MRWTHPTVGVLAALPPELQPRKVWKHLYAPAEAWHMLGLAIDVLIHDVEAAGAPHPSDRELPTRLTADALSTLRAQHDDTWAPVYGEDLVAPDTLVARSVVDGRWLFASTRGVFAVAGDSRGDGAPLISVYRPHRLGLNVPSSNEQYRRRARNRWERETQMSSPDFVSALAAVATPPADAAGTWELALALGRARGVAADNESTIHAAERALANSPYIEAATPREDLVLDAVERAIRDDADDPVAVLLAVEDALLATAELVGKDAAAALSERVGNLLEWAPAAWARVAPFAAHQVGSPAAAGFWSRAADALTAGALREQPARARTTARLTDILVPSVRRKHTERLLRVPGARVVRQVPNAGGYLPAHWRAAPAHLSGDAGWSVVPPTAIRTATVQAWIVDDQHPEGEDITAEFRAGRATSVWTLDPGDDAEIVWVDGIGRSGRLSDAIDAAASNAAAMVGVARITRPT